MNGTWKAHNHVTEEILESQSLKTIINAIRDVADLGPEYHITNWTFKHQRRAKA